MTFLDGTHALARPAATQADDRSARALQQQDLQRLWKDVFEKARVVDARTGDGTFGQASKGKRGDHPPVLSERAMDAASSRTPSSIEPADTNRDPGVGKTDLPRAGDSVTACTVMRSLTPIERDPAHASQNAVPGSSVDSAATRVAAYGAGTVAPTS